MLMRISSGCLALSKLAIYALVINHSLRNLWLIFRLFWRCARNKQHKRELSFVSFPALNPCSCFWENAALHPWVWWAETRVSWRERREKHSALGRRERGVYLSAPSAPFTYRRAALRTRKSFLRCCRGGRVLFGKYIIQARTIFSSLCWSITFLPWLCLEVTAVSLKCCHERFPGLGVSLYGLYLSWPASSYR